MVFLHTLQPKARLALLFVLTLLILAALLLFAMHGVGHPPLHIPTTDGGATPTPDLQSHYN